MSLKTPIYVHQYSVKECKKLEKFVLKNCKKWKKNLNYVKCVTSGFNPDYPPIDELESYAKKNILNFIKPHAIFYKTSFWFNFYKKNQVAEKHDHIPEKISSVLIIKSSEEECLQFHGSNNYLHKIKDKTGLWIFFPSFLPHSTLPVFKDRITLALDFKEKEPWDL